MSAREITDEQIKAFRSESAQAGDLVACAVCDLAIYDDVRGSLHLDKQDSHHLESLNLDMKEIDGVNVTRKEAARALVAEWIADAKAMADE